MVEYKGKWMRVRHCKYCNEYKRANSHTGHICIDCQAKFKKGFSKCLESRKQIMSKFRRDNLLPSTTIISFSGLDNGVITPFDTYGVRTIEKIEMLNEEKKKIKALGEKLVKSENKYLVMMGLETIKKVGEIATRGGFGRGVGGIR